MPFDGVTLENTEAFNFPVETRPLFIKEISRNPFKMDGMKEVNPDKHQAIVRADTQEVLGIHGSRYKLRPFSDMLDNINEALSYSEADISDVDLTDKVYDGGAKMRRQIVINTAKIEPAIGDIMKFKIDMFNSYDGSWAEQYVTWAYRLFCLNGCTTADFSVRSVIKHTNSNWTRDVHVERINRAIEMFFSSENTYRTWIGRELREEQADTLFRRTLAARPRPGDATAISKPVHQHLMEMYDMEPPTLWGAYNAATNWATHIGKSRGATHNVERTRNNEVAKMLRHEEWQKLAA